jgi:catechol 2,3-dioxygenase-like lactoylglutathione lyase family enzyme
MGLWLRRLAVAFACMLPTISTPSAAADDSPAASAPRFANPEPGETVTPVYRAAEFVRDLDESLKLYRDILGFKVKIANTLSGPQFDRILGSKGKTVKFAILRVGDKSDDLTYGSISLWQFVGEKQPPYPRPRHAIRTGDACVILHTKSMKSLAAKVKAGGYSIVSDPYIIGESIEYIFYDRDGLCIDIVQNVPPGTTAIPD